MTFKLKRQWFDAIKSGDKSVEYRRVTPYWAARVRHLKAGDDVIFRLGYKRRDDDIHAVLKAIDIGPCPYDGWDGDFYRFHFDTKESNK